MLEKPCITPRSPVNRAAPFKWSHCHSFQCKHASFLCKLGSLLNTNYSHSKTQGFLNATINVTPLPPRHGKLAVNWILFKIISLAIMRNKSTSSTTSLLRSGLQDCVFWGCICAVTWFAYLQYWSSSKNNAAHANDQNYERLNTHRFALFYSIEISRYYHYKIFILI